MSPDKATLLAIVDDAEEGETDPVEAVKSLTDGNGADVCIEAVGRPEVMEQAFYARDLAGTLVQVGVPDPSMRIELPMIEFFGRGGALKPSWYGDCLPGRDFQEVAIRTPKIDSSLPAQRIHAGSVGGVLRIIPEADSMLA